MNQVSTSSNNFAHIHTYIHTYTEGKDTHRHKQTHSHIQTQRTHSYREREITHISVHRYIVTYTQIQTEIVVETQSLGFTEFLSHSLRTLSQAYTDTESHTDTENTHIHTQREITHRHTQIHSHIQRRRAGHMET